VESDAGPLDSAIQAQLGLTPRWSTSNPGVARIDPRTGVLQAVEPGIVSVVLSSGQYQDQKTLTVVSSAVVPKSDPRDRARSRDELVREASQVIRQYAAAIEAKDLAAMQRVYPGLSVDARRRWQVLFADAAAVRYTVESAEPQGPIQDAEGSEARFQVKYSLSFYSQRERRQLRLPAQETMILVRTDRGWRIRSTE
jgi:hypothetical protein